MPIIANSKLPSFVRLQVEGETVLSLEKASNQDIRSMHIGLLNMMPDAALEATERQFFRLVGSNQILQLHLYPFSLPSIQRGEKAKKHIDNYYHSFDEIKEIGLDGLIITGANVEGEDLGKQVFFDELKQVINWSLENVASTLCSCLATHAVMEILFNEKRSKMPSKYWGVFHHNLTSFNHPLIKGVNSDFYVPHSRFNQITKEQFEKSGVKILVENKDGVHIAVSPDLIKVVFFQGHPEYDTISLLKEYKREIINFLNNNCEYPVFPNNYLTKQAKAILVEFKDNLLSGKMQITDFPEALLLPMITNNWTTDTKIIMNNWVNLIYQTTNVDVKKQFMNGLDSNNPLGLKK
jgi:homoserine O-succinyltransferase